jgi:hypothetical protein
LTVSLWLRYHKPPAEPVIVEFEEMTPDQTCHFLTRCVERLGLTIDRGPDPVFERIMRDRKLAAEKARLSR